MAEITIDAGTLLLNEEDRTATGVLVPFGEEARSNLGIFTADENSFTIPSDLTGLGLNIQHVREDVVGAVTKLSVQPGVGIIGTFKWADTDEGKAAFADAQSGKRKNLSAEVASVIIRGGKAVGGRIFGAAQVEKGAFAGATLLAAEDTSADDASNVEVVEGVVTFDPDENGVITVNASETPKTVTVTVEDNETVFVIEDTNKEENIMADATIPATLTASANGDADKGLSLNGLFSLVNKARNGDHEAGELIRKAGGDSLFAALNDVKYDGTGGLMVPQLPQYVGEVWQARTVGRNVIPQFTTAPLTDTTVKGWKWGTRPEVSTWAGNKANVPTSTPTVAEVAGAIQRFAGGNDIAREFYDFGKTDVIAALLAAYADSYAAKSDAWFLGQVLTASGSGTALAVPVGTPAGLGAVVQGALKIVTAGGKPTVAFVAPDVFASIVYTKKDDTLEYLSAAVGTDLTDGSAAGFSIIPRTELATGNVLVADRRAATALELPGSPIRVNALDMVKGGVDEAVFGYIGAIINDANGLARIIPAS